MNRRTFNLYAASSSLGLLSRRTALASLAGRKMQTATRPVSGARQPAGYMLGTSYYPEWWGEGEWEPDFAQMSELGLNTVRMGEFAWSTYEPEQGKFNFEWMDRAIELASRHGIGVILGTPTASVPPWLYAAHSDVLGASAVAPYSYGGRKGYCTNSAHYRDACAEIVTALAGHYGRNPGVIGWQLDNEPGIPFWCLDANCERAFQVWLERRYVTLDALNHSWNGAFWSNHYTAWSQIHFPKNSAEGGWQPAITLDYRRFFSDSYLNDLRKQAEILRKSVRNQFIATNWPNVTWSVDVYEAGADFLDMTAWDNYVSAPGLTEFQHQYIASMNNDMSRCASRGQRFFCAEQIAYLPSDALPEGLRLQAFLNLAHGSRGHLYFEWRRPLAGNEQARPSFIKGFDGKLTPAGPMLKRIGREFASIAPQLAEATTVADVGLLYDFTNQFAQGFWSVGERTDRYDAEASRVYAGLKSLQRNIDIVPLSADLRRYKILAAPNLRLIDDRTGTKLEQYVAAGGVLLLSPRSGTQNTDGSMRRVVSPGAFTAIAGVSVESKLDLTEYNSAHGQMDEAHEADLGIAFADSNELFKPRTIMESLVLHGAEPVAMFRGGRMRDRPAVARHRHGSGWVIYAGTDSGDHGFHEAIAQVAARASGVRPLLEVPSGVAVTTREDQKTRYYFALNLTETTHDNIALPMPMEDRLGGKGSVKSIRLEPLGVALLSTER